MSIKKSGMISIVGRPNVGKSTLTNALVGEKVAIVSNKPQTTRNRICAILNRGESQFVFLDTPGLHKARTRLGDYMVNVVKESVADVDAEELLEVIQIYGQAHEFTAVVPVSARTGEGVEELLDVLDGFLPQGPQLFPEDMVTDQPERQIMAEILREKGAGGLPARGAPAVPRGHDLRPARAADDGGNFAGKAPFVPGQGDPPRHRRGDHQVFRAG